MAFKKKPTTKKVKKATKKATKKVTKKHVKAKGKKGKYVYPKEKKAAARRRWYIRWKKGLTGKSPHKAKKGGKKGGKKYGKKR